MQIHIPASAIARALAITSATAPDAHPAFKCLRLDNGRLIASNRSIITVEKIEPFDGVFYVNPTPDFAQQVATEATYGAVFTLTLVEGWYTAASTYGWTATDNLSLDVGASEFDRVGEIIRQVELRDTEQSFGGMRWNAHNIRALTAASPSGELSFEQHIDCRQPTVVCDPNDNGWFAIFAPYLDKQDTAEPAKLPTWAKQ